MIKKQKIKPRKLFAKKSLGQNFLIDQNIVDKIISSLNPQKNETIVEIGAGRGALTRKLIERAGNVLAIEIDRELVPILRDEFNEKVNFHLIEQDALEIDFQNLIALQIENTKTKLVANLPYYISTAILQHLIQYRHSFSEMVVMLQKEVVERITAEAGNKERGFLTVLLETYFEMEKLFDVSPNAFRPIPKVISSVIRLKTRNDPKLKISDETCFRELVSCGFQQKRKTLENNLKNATENLKEKIVLKGGLEKLFEHSAIDGKKRAETLTIDEWRRLNIILSET